MEAGQLRHRVILQKQTETQSSISGAVTRSWANDATLWGSVQPLTGREAWRALQVRPETTHMVRLRHRNGVNAEKRILAPKETTTLGAAITTTDGTSITVAADLGVSASTQFRILIDSELMLVTAGHGTTTWTVERGADGTTGATHANAAVVTLMGILEILDVKNMDERNIKLELMCKESP